MYEVCHGFYTQSCKHTVHRPTPDGGHTACSLWDYFSAWCLKEVDFTHRSVENHQAIFASVYAAFRRLKDDAEAPLRSNINHYPFHGVWLE
jgi:hypothetical protein